MNEAQVGEVRGPVWDDENGELDQPILTCRRCTFLRRHDFHYTFCAGQGGRPSYWSNGETVVQLYRGAYPNETCPYPAPMENSHAQL